MLPRCLCLFAPPSLQVYKYEHHTVWDLRLNSATGPRGGGRGGRCFPWIRIWYLHSQDSQHGGLMCAHVCPLKTLDLVVKNRHLDPFTDQMICKLIVLPPLQALRR